MENLTPLLVGLIVLSLAIWGQLFRRNTTSGLPPGPKPLPLIGNIRDLPAPGIPEYQHWIKFKDTYGPISSVSILGQPMILLHDKKAVRDLLEQTSLKTSLRPSSIFADGCGFGNFLPFRQYNDTYRWHRKLVHQQIGTKVMAARFNDVQDVESRRFLLRVLQNPEDLVKHFKTEASAIVLKITYGYAIEPLTHDPLVSLVERMMDNMSLALVPLAWIVDILPFMNHLPEGFPGTSFKTRAREWNQVNQTVTDAPFKFVRRHLAAGTHRTSYVSQLIEKYGTSKHGELELSPEEENAIKQTAAILYGGGADTTVSTLSSFVLAMILFPDVQQKAQQEIDKVIGNERLPDFSDRHQLPYVSALVSETLRWLPVTPIGTPHVTDDEIMYNGFRIPKGTYLLPSIWWFLHDPETYANPSDFDPDRYLEPRNEPDPTTESFGYGRRICPGRFLAMESLFITVSRILAAFHISKDIGEDGEEVEANLQPTAGLICHPEPFPYRIEPRTMKHSELILSVEKEHPWERSDAESLEL
ncbi:unnamed protein product [Clonostachys rhizophaga]|uniref:O-methylsterigmatocystin oxidoreductase n=1 Tax=Clonostachys rhizophaga TaxID=160324 RepID=A0A9N9YIA3_9HYPO|nr:unnamed protein product [Clonostachys rhizophaga]